MEGQRTSVWSSHSDHEEDALPGSQCRLLLDEGADSGCLFGTSWCITVIAEVLGKRGKGGRPRDPSRQDTEL